MSPTIEPWLREILRCPLCRNELVDATGADGGAELHCDGDCEQPGQRRAYRIDDGIPVLLAEEARTFQV
ncbi:Trm112 family protein [Luteipulveratus mongoliensis]|uniref:Tetraacyldisaccharide 4'-kinase n=1 Tax=Luteipulveratus mongoliensis TaxID=571913 RepID=A0A0K1JHQ4_9MICO|nr:Trm112 family protein [Luteipulveratus mongoliensis]AKU16226.1 hypothetical protein VV02_10735 [Luteipulveratus mongoliensis]